MTPITADDPRFTQLDDLQDTFDKASADGKNFDLPPDGEYQAIVDRFDFFESKDNTKLFLKTETTVQNHPTHNGRPIEFIHQLNDPERLDWLKQHLKRLGADVDQLRLSELRPGSQTLADLCDVPIQVTVKTSNRVNTDTGQPYRNAYVDMRLGPPLRQDFQRTGQTDIPTNDDPPPPAGAPATAPGDDVIPF